MLDVNNSAYPNWDNCHADRVASGYPKMVRGFLSDVIKPSISKLNSQIKGYSESEDPVALFYLSDSEDVLSETMKAFCLSVHSIWERQLRGYLIGCATVDERHHSLTKKIEIVKWEDLCELFLKLRGISIQSFEAYDELHKLQLVANACRHGEGPSARKLYELHPEFWPKRAAPPFPMPGISCDQIELVRYSELVVTPQNLTNYVVAVESFWEQANYIYNESISKKHPSMMPTLEAQRKRWLR